MQLDIHSFVGIGRSFWAIYTQVILATVITLEYSITVFDVMIQMKTSGTYAGVV